MSPESPSDVRFFGLCSDNYLHIKSRVRRQVHFHPPHLEVMGPETRNRLDSIQGGGGRRLLPMGTDSRQQVLAPCSSRGWRMGRSPAHSRRSCRPTPAVPSDRPTPTTLSPTAASRPVSAGTALRTGIGRAVKHHFSTLIGLSPVGATVRGSTPRRSTRIAMNQLHSSKKPPPQHGNGRRHQPHQRPMPASHRAARSNRPEIDGQPRQ